MKRTDTPVNPVQARTDARERRRRRRGRSGLAGFIGKYFLLFSALMVVMVVVDFVLYVAISLYAMQGGADDVTGPTQLSTRICSALEPQEDGSFDLAPEMEQRLDREGVWGFLMAADGSVVWTSKGTPTDAVLPDSAQDIALVAHYGTLGANPAFVYTPANNDLISSSGAESLPSDDSLVGVENVGTDTLLVLVYPQGSRVIFPTTSFSSSSFGAIGLCIAVILLVDLAILFIAYVVSRRSVFRGIRPVSEGIGKLAQGEPVRLDAHGDLADIADDVNAASDIIRAKDAARVNWISGVSHDIRTPLSMVMGYADRIAENPAVPERSRTEASIIRAQSMKMRDLVEDLNLASKLEYDLQPVGSDPLSPAALVRATAAEFMDATDPALYSLDVDVDPRAQHVVFEADRRLLGRAVRNLLQNAVSHNPQGCSIVVSLGIADASGIDFPASPRNASQPNCAGRKAWQHGCSSGYGSASTAWYVRVSDDGVGVDAAELVVLQNGPASLGDAAQQRGDGFASHGLGLLLVRGIARVHGGTVLFASEGKGRGFSATLAFPLDATSQHRP